MEDILQRYFLAGTPQSTDFCFYAQCLLVRRILKWVLTQETRKFIIAEVETKENDEARLPISQTPSDCDQADLYADDPLANEELAVK